MTIIRLTCECELVTDSSSLVYCITCMCKTSAVFKKKNIGSQPNFSRIFTYRDNSAQPNISRIFVLVIRNFFKNSAWGSTFDCYVSNLTLPLMPAVAINSVPDRVKPSFVIFDIRAL